MAKPNYQYEKRQRELAKKAKKAEKSARKTVGKGPEDDLPGEGAGQDVAAPTEPAGAVDAAVDPARGGS